MTKSTRLQVAAGAFAAVVCLAALYAMSYIVSYVTFDGVSKDEWWAFPTFMAILGVAIGSVYFAAWVIMTVADSKKQYPVN